MTLHLSDDREILRRVGKYVLNFVNLQASNELVDLIKMHGGVNSTGNANLNAVPEMNLKPMMAFMRCFCRKHAINTHNMGDRFNVG